MRLRSRLAHRGERAEHDAAQGEPEQRHGGGVQGRREERPEDPEESVDAHLRHHAG